MDVPTLSLVKRWGCIVMVDVGRVVSRRKERRSPATPAASSSSSSSNWVQNFFHDRCSDCPKDWLLTSRSASPDVPRSSGHLRTALNQRFDSSVTRLLLPLDCPSSSRREPYIDIPLTHHFRLSGFTQLSRCPSCRLKQRPQRGSKVREPLLDPSPSSVPSDFFSPPPGRPPAAIQHLQKYAAADCAKDW